mmetsp:Transcript_6013/g.9528  ORF Transcript_6013/g.9528 Transcript_6013/m.9528 type:complete len:538 (+) Transcript_6013:237-1850(+)
MQSNQFNETETGGGGVLSDVLEELDRERSKRISLESDIQEVKDDKNNITQAGKLAPETTEREMITLIATKKERDGFREIVDALTENNKAISAATKNNKKKEKSLLAHVVRMLEVMPHDPRAIQCAIAKEEVYEWQVYKSGKWQHLLRYFPPIIRKLPIVQPKLGSAIEDAESRQLFPELPPKQCVLTNPSMTKIVKLDNGFSLPQDGGTWEWISGWLIDKHDTEESSQRSSRRSKRNKIDCDTEGWSYAEEPQHFITSPADLCWDEPLMAHNKVQRPYRRRRWTRQRALRAYPHASQKTMEYLRLLSENSRLSVTNTKLSDQLVETKTKLTEIEGALVSACEETAKEQTDLQHLRIKLTEINETFFSAKKEAEKQKNEFELQFKKQDEEIQETQKQITLKINEKSPPKREPRRLSFLGEKTKTNVTETVKPETNNNVVENIVSKEQIEKMKNVAGGFASSLVSSATNAASNAFRKTLEDRTVNTDAEEESISSSVSSTENRNFDWKMIGRGALIEKVSPAGASFLQNLGRKTEEETV